MKSSAKIRTYSELLTFPTFEERFFYLKLDGTVGEDTFGFDRWMNQQFYRSREWKKIRDEVIIRDNGCDLGLEGYEIHGKVLIHHMNPIGIYQLQSVFLEQKTATNDAAKDLMLNPEYLICVSHRTHNAIHYGDEHQIARDPVIRKPNDTCPWK